jgi:hypothetical protein
MADRSNKMAAQGRTTRRRRHQGAGFAGSLQLRDRAGQRSGSLPDHRLQDSGHIIQDGATAHPSQPRCTLKPGYPPDLQWNGLLHCPSDASQ